MEVELSEYAKNILVEVRKKPHHEQINYLLKRTSEIKDENERETVKQFIILHLQNPNSPNGKEKKYLILIHGIRTYSAWQDLVKERFKNDDIDVVPLKYGWFNMFGFLLPLFWRSSFNKILKDLRRIQSKNPGCEINLISHSFGTFLTGELLGKAQDVNVNNIILCGSILPSKFDWNDLPRSIPDNKIVNDIGTKDILPVIAKQLIYKEYGNSGAFGFGSSVVIDRHHDFGHSGFFSSEFIDKYWKPFILNDEIIESEWSHKRSTPSLFMQVLDNFWYYLIIVLFIWYLVTLIF